MDVPGDNRKQKTVSLGPCATRTVARQKLRDYIEECGVNSKAQFYQNTAPATTFKTQSDRWLDHMATRTRKPVKPATIAAAQQALRRVLPFIGDKLLAEVSNGAVRDLVGKLMRAGLSPKTVVNYVQVVKAVVASAVNDEGEQIYPRTWNHDFIGLPVVHKEQQHRPTLTETELGEILSSVKERYAVLFALLAGTGLRIGEALGLKPPDMSPDCRVLNVRRSIWGGKEQEPKTGNAVRVVDVPETLARILRTYTAGKSGYVFATAKGRPLMPRNVLRVLHDTGKHVGFHAFRRYRAAVLRKTRVPEDLLKLWLGHARNLTDNYAAQLREDEQYRGEWCQRAGLGFSVVTLLHAEVVPIDMAKVA